MKQVNGFWLPNNEEHLVSFLLNGPEFAGGPTYQISKLIAALPFVKNFRRAVDIGAHCGLWARPLAAMFGTVVAFEPVTLHRECLEENIAEYAIDNISVRPYALGNDERLVRLHTGKSSSGDTYVTKDGEHEAEMRTLDSFGLHDVDFIKIDVEGHELEVLKGGAKTIVKYKPIIVVEQKGHDQRYFGQPRDSAVHYLRDTLGMKSLRDPISGDWFMGW